MKTGFIKRVLPEKHYGFVACFDDARDYFCRLDKLTTASPAGHMCLLTPGREVRFTVATDFIINKEYVDSVELPDTLGIDREESIVETWHGTFGFAKRLCSESCRIYIHEDSVLTYGVMAPGTRIYHGAYLGTTSLGRPSWRTSNVEIIKSEF